MTLQDETITGGNQEAETSASGSQSAAAAKADRVKVRYDVAAESVTVEEDGKTIVHTLAGIPANVRTHLALMGLGRVTIRATNANETLARMRAGEVPGRVPASPKALGPWLMAYAHAKVETTKKSEAPVSLDDAMAIARNLTKEKLNEVKIHPVVVKHYNRLTGAPGELV